MPAQFDSDSIALIEGMGEHGDCFKSHFAYVDAVFNALNVGALRDGGPSKQVRNLVEGKMLAKGWESRVLIDRQLPLEMPLANYTVDYQLIFQSERCNYNHQLVVEMCFDNRQAIGTNVLKADLANRNFMSVADRTSIGILVVLNSGARETGRWDNGVGVQDEYSLALRRVYDRNILSPIFLLVVT